MTEQRLASLEFRAIYDRAPAGIAIASLDRRIIACNLAYERIVGYSEAESRAGIFPLATHPDDAARDMALFRELAAGRLDTYRIEKRYIRRDGGIVQGQLTAALVRDTTGRPCSAIGLVADVTTRKAVEAGLTDAQHQLALADELAARHETEIRWLHSGLTPRERRVLELVVQGMTNRQISIALNIQPGTVKTHVHNIGKKLELADNGRDAVVRAARQRGLLPLRSECREADTLFLGASPAALHAAVEDLSTPS